MKQFWAVLICKMWKHKPVAGEAVTYSNGRKGSIPIFCGRCGCSEGDMMMDAGRYVDVAIRMEEIRKSRLRG